LFETDSFLFRAYNVMNCETARFLMVENNDVIETVSFYVPRKDVRLTLRSLVSIANHTKP